MSPHYTALELEYHHGSLDFHILSVSAHPRVHIILAIECRDLHTIVLLGLYFIMGETAVASMHRAVSPPLRASPAPCRVYLFVYYLCICPGTSGQQSVASPSYLTCSLLISGS